MQTARLTSALLHWGVLLFFLASSILISVNFPNELTEDVITGKAADPTKKSN